MVTLMVVSSWCHGGVMVTPMVTLMVVSQWCHGDTDGDTTATSCHTDTPGAT